MATQRHPALTRALELGVPTRIVHVTSGRFVIGKADENRRRPSIQTKELKEVSRKIGKLAVARYRQAGDFRIRQKEKLRRALQDAAEDLNWEIVASTREDPIQEVAQDVHRLTGAGVRALERDLDSEIAEKRRELKRLERTIETLTALAAEKEAAFPAEVTYTYTGTRGRGVYLTKVEELVLEDPEGAARAAAKLEKGMKRFGRSRDAMVEGLKRKRTAVRQAGSDLQDFVRGTHRVVGEVLATLA